MIHESLKALAEPIESFQQWERNPRKGNIEAIKASLQRFQQRHPIVYKTHTINGQQYRTVYAGNHRLQAALELGWTQIAAVNADDLTEEEAQAFALVDNRTSDLATIDDELIAALLQDLNTDIEIPGFDDDYLDFIATKNLDDDTWHGALDKIPDGEASEFTTITFTMTESELHLVEAQLKKAASGMESTINQRTGALIQICLSYDS